MADLVSSRTIGEILHLLQFTLNFVLKSAFHKALLGLGLVKQLKQPSFSRQTERRLIQVQGQPISQTIIEGRR